MSHEEPWVHLGVKFFRTRDREALLMALREEFEAHDARLMLQDATSEY